MAERRSVRFYANEELFCVGPGKYELCRHDGTLILAFAAINDEVAQNSPGIHRLIRNALEAAKAPTATDPTE